MPLSDVLTSFLQAPARAWRNVSWFCARTIARDVEVVFVLGTPRSGTTLLQSLLCGHSRLCGPAGETSGVFMFRDAFEPRYADFSPAEQAAMTGSSADLIDFYRKYVHAICQRENALCFVDKMVGVSPYFIRLVTRHLPRARLVYISRDGRDAYCSARNNQFVPQRASIAGFARLYARNEARRRRWLAHLPTHYHLKYEALVTDAGAELSRLMNFLGFSLEPQQLAIAATHRHPELSEPEHHANLRAAIAPRSVGRFQSELTAAEIEEFHRHAGSTLRTLGYA